MKRLLTALLAVVLTGAAFAQGPAGSGGAGGVKRGATLPAACKIGDVFFKTTSTGTAIDLYKCTATDTWVAVGQSAGLTNPLTTAGDIPVGGTNGAFSRLAVNGTATRKFLLSVSGATSLSAVTEADLLGLNPVFGAIVGQPANDAAGLIARRNSAAQTNLVFEVQTEGNGHLAGIDKAGGMDATSYKVGATPLNFTHLAAGNIPIGQYYIDMAEITAPANPAAGSCRFYVDSSTHQITFKNSAGTSCLASSGGTWGSITGTLSSQTDLQNALDAKVPTTRTVNGQALSGNVTITTITGNAGTATALAANGANCSAGQAPLGVDASGAVEGCFTPSGALPAGVTSDGSNGLTVTGQVAAASVKAGSGSYLFTAAGENAAGVIHDDGLGNMTSAKVSSADVDTTVSKVIASGTAAMPTSSIAAGACATVVTVSATGVATTDVISWTPNADISGVTGYTPAGTLRIYPYPTANNVNFKVCNGHASDAVTPGAVTLNFRVTR